MIMWAPSFQSRTLANKIGSADRILLLFFFSFAKKKGGGDKGSRQGRGEQGGLAVQRVRLSPSATAVDPPWVCMAAHSNEVTKNAKNATLTPK